jgi:hypothetical protein
MDLKQLSLRLEISFWNMAIELLSKSAFFRGLVRWVYRACSGDWLRSTEAFQPSRALIWALVGLALGFCAGLLSGFSG